jgi:hypothetical protein
MAEMREKSKTAAAERSFTWPAVTLNPGDTMSTSFSIAVLISSAVITTPIQSSKTHHSVALILKNSPAIMTSMAEMICKRKFRSFSASFRPLKAKPKDLISACLGIPVKNNIFYGVSRNYYLCDMKSVFAFLSLVLIMSQGCEETPPFIDFTNEVVTDTGYVDSSSVMAQHKIVLIEDVTGVRCVNCPTAAKKIKDIIAAKSEDSVIAMALYPWPTNTNSLFNNTAPYENFPQMANDIGSQLVESIGIPQGLPSGYVDRFDFGASEKPKALSAWSTLVDQRLRDKTPVNITIGKTLTGRRMTIDANLLYTANVRGSHKVAVYLTEDHVISKQKTPSGDLDNYEHNHAVRYSFDLSVGGTLPGSLFKGKAYKKHYEYELPADSEVKLENCHVVCVVTDALTGAVVNVRKIALQ